METPVEETSLPRYVLFRKRRVRVVGYLPANEARSARFLVIDTDDTQRSVRREQITFLKK